MIGNIAFTIILCFYSIISGKSFLITIKPITLVDRKILYAQSANDIDAFMNKAKQFVGDSNSTSLTLLALQLQKDEMEMRMKMKMEEQKVKMEMETRMKMKEQKDKIEMKEAYYKKSLSAILKRFSFKISHFIL